MNNEEQNGSNLSAQEGLEEVPFTNGKIIPLSKQEGEKLKISIINDIKNQFSVDITKPKSYENLSAQSLLSVWRIMNSTDISDKEELVVFQKIKNVFLQTFEKNSRQIEFSESINKSKENFCVANLRLSKDKKEFLTLWVLGSEIVKINEPFNPEKYTDAEIERLKRNELSAGAKVRSYRL
ncbi:MAG: hypothetical protein KBD48_01455 [Candidatus Pacebacteria bacterium]|nr:hypothetical protein [Candidatus Paceibacterota bacterium]MBP9715840.1 hypothetical protein [Candidatus Paceibacterota bacterium]